MNQADGLQVRLQNPTGVPKVMRLIPVGNSDFFSFVHAREKIKMK